MKTKQLEELLLQSLEHEMGGVKVYAAALSCAQNADLKKEWRSTSSRPARTSPRSRACARRLNSTPRRRRRAERSCAGRRRAGRRHEDREEAGDPAAAELVACECVVLAETKDHLDWELLGKCASISPAHSRRR